MKDSYFYKDIESQTGLNSSSASVYCVLCPLGLLKRFLLYRREVTLGTYKQSRIIRGIEKLDHSPI